MAFAEGKYAWLISRVRLCHHLVPSGYRRAGHVGIECIGVVSLLLAILLYPWARDWGRPFEVLLVLATIMSLRRIVREDPDAWIYLVFIAVVLWTITINLLSETWYPHWTADRLEGTRDCARLFLFAVCGWWMGATRRGIVTVGLCATLAVLLGYVIQHPGNPIHGWLAPHGGEFGYRNSQHAAVVTGPVLLALLLLVRRIVLGALYPAALFRALTWASAVGICLLALGATGNRQVWLGIFAGVIVAGVVVAVGCRRNGMRNLHSGRGPLLIVMSALVIGGAIAFSAAPAWERLQRESSAISDYFATEGGNPRITSATIRLMLWEHSFKVIANRPILGYGGQSGRPLINSSDLPAQIKQNYGHVHNSYLALWTSYGLMAPTLFLAIIGGLAYRALNAWKASLIPTDVTALFVAWMAYFAVINVFESYVNRESGVFLMMILGGAVYSATLHHRRLMRANAGEAVQNPIGT